MNTPLEDAGFIAPAEHPLGQERRAVALAALIASATLAFSTVVVATVVSVGIARAGIADTVIDSEGSLFAIALALGLLFIGAGGLTVLTRDRTGRTSPDSNPNHPTAA